MIRLAARILLTAILFCYVFPDLINGLHFHGQLWPEGIVYSAVFALVTYAFEVVLALALAVFAVGTLGLGLLLIIPAAILGFWLIPAAELQLFAHYFPHHFTVDSWGAAILGGLLLLVVNGITAQPKGKKKSSS